eukprot:jgi/Undpi1/5808/HiC_scaffold_2.g01082.m1
MNSGIASEMSAYQVAVGCHALTAFSCYAVSNADAATSSSLPTALQSVATVVAHGLIGMSLGLCSWSVLAATAGANLAPRMAEGSSALGGTVAAGAVCSVCYALSFLHKREHQLRFGRSSHTSLSSFVLGSLKEGFLVGPCVAAGYVVLRCLSELVPGSRLGGALAALLGLPIGNGGTSDATNAGRLLVGCLVLLSASVNFSLHAFSTKIMNAVIAAPQDFVALWQANAAAAASTSNGGGGGGRSMSEGPASPAAMLLDSLSVGHEAVLLQAEQDFLDDRGSGGGGGGGVGGYAGGPSSLYKRGSIGAWAEEVELQRRALALASVRIFVGEGPMAAAAAAAAAAWARRQGWGTGGWGRGRGRGLAGVPLWAQVAKVQALQSLALKAPADKNLRAALYEFNIAQVLRALCLELDETSLHLQAAAFRDDPAATARSLGYEGRGDVKWLVQGASATAAAAAAGPGGHYRQPWMQTVKDGVTFPFQGTLKVLLCAVQRLIGAVVVGGGGGGGGGRDAGRSRGGREEGSQLSTVRIQSVLWAAQGVSALMVSAPGESRGCSLDAMLPVVLGSLAGLLLALQPSSEGEEEALPEGPKKLAFEAVEKALSAIATRYRSCLPDFRFPPVYAETINKLCA